MFTFFSATMQSIWLNNESEVGKTSYGAVAEKQIWIGNCE